MTWQLPFLGYSCVALDFYSCTIEYFRQADTLSQRALAMHTWAHNKCYVVRKTTRNIRASLAMLPTCIQHPCRAGGWPLTLPHCIQSGNQHCWFYSPICAVRPLLSISTAPAQVHTTCDLLRQLPSTLAPIICWLPHSWGNVFKMYNSLCSPAIV